MKEKRTEMKNVVLLTGTINTEIFNNTGNKICDIKERLNQYENSIYRYIRDSEFSTIVFGENSGYPFDARKYECIANTYGKKFEFVSCPSYVEETIRCGKSYGEARVIDDILKRSELLQTEDIIYKLTGRIFLENSKDICKTANKRKNEFIIYDNKKWCFTNIFKFSKNNYLKYWDKVYEQCDEKNGNDIERVFYQIICEAVKEGLDVGSFNVWPCFDGIQGATLEPYTGGKMERCLRSFLCKAGCFTYGTKASKFLKI